MKVLYKEESRSIVLDESTGNISVIQDGVLVSFVKEHIVVKVIGYVESEIALKKKDETPGELDGGLEISKHVGSWNWVTCALVPRVG